MSADRRTQTLRIRRGPDLARIVSVSLVDVDGVEHSLPCQSLTIESAARSVTTVTLKIAIGGLWRLDDQLIDYPERPDVDDGRAASDA